MMKTVLFILLLFTMPLAAHGQGYAPAVDHLSLLGMRYYAQTGGLMVEGLQVIFPPSEDAGASFTVTNAGGETVGEVPLRLERWPDHPSFGQLRPKGPGIVQLNQAGAYTMRVYLGDAVIASMDYTLDAEGGDDPFNPQKSYQREGPWRSLAYLSAPMERPDEALRFNYWTSLREVAGTPNRAKLSLRLLRGTQQVAASRSDYVASSTDWQFFNHPLVKPDGKHHFTLADLTVRDGAYTLMLLADGQSIKTYTFTVEGGAVLPSPRSALPGAARPDFLTPRRINTSAGSTSRYFMEHVFWVETR